MTPKLCKAIAATLLVFTLPGCASQLPWAPPSGTSMNQSPVEELRLHEPPPAANQAALDADETSITGSVLGDQPIPFKPANKQASCDRRRAVSVGMTRTQVYASCWGKPTSINASRAEPYEYELLVYQGFDYVYLENGVVKAVQVSSR